MPEVSWFNQISVSDLNENDHYNKSVWTQDVELQFYNHDAHKCVFVAELYNLCACKKFGVWIITCHHMGGYVLQCSEDLDFIKERSNKKHDHTNIKPVFCLYITSTV